MAGVLTETLLSLVALLACDYASSCYFSSSILFETYEPTFDPACDATLDAFDTCDGAPLFYYDL